MHAPRSGVIGAVELPTRFRLYEIRDDRAYGVSTDSLGVRVVILRLTRERR